MTSRTYDAWLADDRRDDLPDDPCPVAVDWAAVMERAKGRTSEQGSAEVDTERRARGAA